MDMKEASLASLFTFMGLLNSVPFVQGFIINATGGCFPVVAYQEVAFACQFYNLLTSKPILKRGRLQHYADRHVGNIAGGQSSILTSVKG